MTIFDTLFTSDPDKIAENKKLPILYLDSKMEDRGERCKGYWQNPDDKIGYSNIKDEQGL